MNLCNAGLLWDLQPIGRHHQKLCHHRGIKHTNKVATADRALRRVCLAMSTSMHACKDRSSLYC